MNLRRLDQPDHALGLAVSVADHDLDRVDALSRTASGRAPASHKLGQLGVQTVFERPVMSQCASTMWVSTKLQLP
jgi:hypothetical protein